ncbi:MAG: PilZ domain-containing protein [Vicinamibacterales bacterium]
MKDKQDDDAPITVSLETLARHILETPRNELSTLRAAFDRQISSIEARMEASTHQPAIDATVKIVAEVIGEHVNRARQRAETDVTQALAVNTMLRKALDNAQQQLESAQADMAAVDADRKAMAVQHREGLNEKKKLSAALDRSHAQLLDVQAQLKNSHQETEELAAERLELQRKLEDVTAAKAVAVTQYQQLASASQKLTDGLSRTLHGQREQARPVAAAPSIRSESAEDKAAAKSTRVSATPAKSTPSAVPAAASAVSARKKPLQFSEQARDARRVRIRRGTHVNVDGIPGELVDLSVGGAQAVVRQMVKPNQLVRLILPTAAGQLICKGRIVWVVYEQPGTSLSVYRFGVKFTDVEAETVEGFMQDFGDESLAQSRRTSEIA